MSGALEVLAPLLAAVQTGERTYRRCWERPEGPGVPPWSTDDRLRWARLADLDPAELVVAADRLDQVAADLHGTGSALGTIGAVGTQPGVAPGAAHRCAAMSSLIGARAAEATELAQLVRHAAARLEGVLDDLAHRIPRSVEGWVEGRAEGWDDPPTDDRRALHGWAQRHATMLGALRDGLDTADRSLAAPWCPADTVCAVQPSVSLGQDRWAGVAPDIEFVPGPTYSPRLWSTWGQLPDQPVPGAPVLAGAEADRVEAVTGVRVAELPDLPAELPDLPAGRWQALR